MDGAMVADAAGTEPLRLGADDTLRLGAAVLDRSPSVSIGSFRLPRPGTGRRLLAARPSKFGSCDSNSYCLSCMSVIFVGLGGFITVTTLGGTKFSLGHMWSVGPIFFCVGVMMAMKCYVYLRSKREIEMLFIAEIVCQQMMRLEDEGRRRLVERSQHLLNSHGITRDIFTLVSDTSETVAWGHAMQQPERYGSRRSVESSSPAASSLRGMMVPPPPPPYESLHLSVSNDGSKIERGDCEAPPPSYTEAVALMISTQQQIAPAQINQNTSLVPQHTIDTSLLQPPSPQR